MRAHGSRVSAWGGRKGLHLGRRRVFAGGELGGHFVERHVVGFAGAQKRELFDDVDFARDGQFAGSDFFAALDKFGAQDVRLGGEQGKRFAFVLVRQADHGAFFAAGGRKGDPFAGFERNHFAGDFCEALHAPFDEDEAVLVDVDDVAGLVPGPGVDVAVEAEAGFEDGAFDFAVDFMQGLVGLDVAFHKVRAAHVQGAAFVDAFDFFKDVFDAGDELPDRSDPVRHGRVDGQHRRGLGKAVAFHDAQSELVVVELAGGVGELFGSGDDVADAGEVEVVGLLAVVGKKGIRAEKHGAVLVVYKFGDDLVFERRGEQHGRDPAHERIKRSAGHAEGMEERQAHHDLVFGGGVDEAADLPDVGNERFVGVGDALGLAFAAAGVEDDGFRVGGCRLAGGEFALFCDHGFAGKVEASGELFQIVDFKLGVAFLELLHKLGESAFFDELFAGGQRFDAGDFDGVVAAFESGSVVEHARGFVLGVERIDHVDGGSGVGHENPDPLFVFEVALDI